VEIPAQKEDAITQTGATQQGSEQAADKTAIRPFRVNVPETELSELRKRINATKGPERETVTDRPLGLRIGSKRQRRLFNDSARVGCAKIALRS
jgi:hypothetical protein